MSEMGELKSNVQVIKTRLSDLAEDIKEQKGDHKKIAEAFNTFTLQVTRDIASLQQKVKRDAQVTALLIGLSSSLLTSTISGVIVFYMKKG